MPFANPLFFAYVVAPLLLGLASPFLVSRRKILPWIGFGLSGLGILTLVILQNALSKGNELLIEFHLIRAAGISLSLRLETASLAFLFALELIYALVFFRLRSESNEFVVECLLFFTKGITVLLLLCTQLLTLGAIHFLAAVLFAFLIYFPARSEGVFVKIPARFFVTQAMASLLLLAWSVAATPVTATPPIGYLPVLWSAMVFALPVAPVNSWFEELLRRASSVISIAVTVFVAVLLFRFLELGRFMHGIDPQSVLPWMAGAGFLVALLALIRAYSIRKGRALFAMGSQFLMGVCLLAYGFSSARTFDAALMLSILIPLLTSLLLTLEFDGLADRRLMIVVIGLLVVLAGFPGTAVFAIWAYLGERALELGGLFPLTLGILWLAYLLLNLLFFREVLVVSRSQLVQASAQAQLWIQLSFMVVFMAATWLVVMLGGKLI